MTQSLHVGHVPDSPNAAPVVQPEPFSADTTPRHSSHFAHDEKLQSQSHSHDGDYDQEAILCSRCRQDIHDIDNADHGDKEYNPGEDTSNIVTWDGDDDPARPMNMPEWRKWLIVVTTGLMTFIVAFASSIFSAVVPVTSKKFHVGEEVMTLGVALYVLGFAFGPLLWGPASEVFGRTRPLFLATIAFMLFEIPVGVAQNVQTIMVCRFFSGTFGAAPLAIVAGMYVDFFGPVNTGVACAWFSGATMLGPTLGPVLGNFITYSHLGWRWTVWITMIMSALIIVVCWATTPETFEPVLLRWKAQRLRHETGNWALHSKSEEHKIDGKTLMNKYLTKPLVMIVKEPILIILTMYTSLVYGILYGTFEAYPYSFGTRRGWKPQLAALPFLSILIGVVIACLGIAVFTKTYFAKQLAIHKKTIPEARIPIMFLGSITLPIGLFWFGWTSSPEISWVPQVIAGIFIGAGIVWIFTTCIVYMVDVYQINANSAISINTFVRSLFGVAFPLFSGYMYKGIGTEWGSSLLGFLCVGLIPFPVIFWFYGKKIRSWSKFAFVA